MTTKRLDNSKMIFCGTRYGTKAHIASPGSSVTQCGHWMKFQASAYALPLTHGRQVCARCVDPARVTVDQLIEHGVLVSLADATITEPGSDS